MAKSVGGQGAILAIEALLGVIFGMVLYIATSNVMPILTADLANATFPGSSLIRDVGVLLISIAAFLIGFLIPFLAVFLATDQMG